MRELRVSALLALALLVAASSRAQPLTILDVPFVAQSELLCGGAAAAMVMRYWGERGVDAEAFRPLVDARAGGIRTDALTADLRARRWNALELHGSAASLDREIAQGRPVIALINDHANTYHYVVVVARNADGVVFHDPARTPFRVASTADFDKRWAASGRWMLVVTPAAPGEGKTREAATPAEPSTPCERRVGDGVERAQQNDLEAAERTLASALSCPGSAAFRELAGVRVLQRRWPEAADLAAAALARDPSDTYASKILATARFVGDDKLGALDAWNKAGEPRVDLIRVGGLSRTREKIVERAIGVPTGTMLTRGALERAQRRAAELPGAPGTVDFAPLSSGLAELRANVAERPLVPRSAVEAGALAVTTSITRELSIGIASPTGGGEAIALDWRFWAHRPLYAASIAAPAPWGGVWRLGVSRERQPFSAVFAPSLHDAAHLDVADWATGAVRWQIGAGLDRWNRARTFGSASAGVRFASAGDRVDARGDVRSWFGGGSEFARGEVRVLARSSARMTGFVLTGDGGVAAVNSAAPPDLWLAGDTGRARPLLLRAHPVLGENERLLTQRMSRLFSHATGEAQRWWAIGPLRAGIATFADVGHSARRLAGAAITDVDIGAGLRAAYPGGAGLVRLDIARGYRDGDIAVSVVYTSAVP